MSTWSVHSEIHKGSTFRVLRATRLSDGKMAVLKLLREDVNSQAAVVQLRHEAAMLDELALAGCVGIPQYFGIVDEAGMFGVAIEDMGGESLDSWMPSLGVAEVIAIGLSLSHTLTHVHRAGIVHKDINPSNVIYNRERNLVQLVDFGIATRAQGDSQQLQELPSFAGTALFLAPEQTGRMNRAVDLRSDIYALGATLYALATKKLPFEEAGMVELIHAVLAKTPVPAHQIAEQVPRSLSDVIAKMMEKSASDRYQSAEGVRRDLMLCEALLQRKDLVGTFVLGTADRNERFVMTQKLYGRATEIQMLRLAFDSALSNKRTFAWVTGPQGIGKTALVREIQPTLASNNAMFITARAEAYKAPLDVLKQCIEGIVRRALTGDDAEVGFWKRSISSALGQLGRVLTNVSPALELLIGMQPPIATLPPNEDKVRLLLVMRRFFDAVCDRQPLVVVLDDMQWCDLTSLEVLAELSREGPHKMLVICVSRSADVGEDHPLTRAMRAIQGQAPVFRIEVGALSDADIRALLRETLRRAPSNEVDETASMVLMKTHGNPLLVRELLRALAQEGVFRYEPDQDAWRCDLRAAHERNVADLALSDVESSMGAAHRALDRLDRMLPQVPAGIERARMQHRRALALHTQGRYDEAVHASVDGLASIQIKVTSVPSAWRLKLDFTLLDQRIKSVSPDTIARMPPPTDEQLGVASSLLSTMLASARTGGHIAAATHAGIKLATLTLNHGPLKGSAIGIAQYVAAKALRGEWDRLDDWAELVRILVERVADSTQVATAIFLTLCFCEHHHHTPAEMAKRFAEVQARGLAAGDFTYAVWGAIFSADCLAMVSGTEALRRLRMVEPFVKRAGNVAQQSMLASLQRFIVGMGSTQEERLPRAPEDALSILTTSGDTQPAVYDAVCRLQAEFFHGYPERAVALMRQFHAILDARDRSSATVVQATGIALCAMIECDRRAHTRKYTLSPLFLSRQQVLREAVSMEHSMLRPWELLVEAEFAELQGDVSRALKTYNRVIEATPVTGCALLGALALECTARCMQRHGLDEARRQYIRRAVTAYRNWGAAFKVSLLENEFPADLYEANDEILRPSGESIGGRTASGSGGALAEARMNYDLLFRTMSALAASKAVSAVIRALTELLMAASGADRCVFFLTKEGEGVEKASDVGVASDGPVPMQVINFVRSAKALCLIDDASSSHEFSSVSYFRAHTAKSVMCLPVIGRGGLRAVLYMENHSATHIFGPHRVEIIKLIGTQAALALENASLYEDLERQVTVRSQQLEETQQKLVALERDRTETAMAGGFAHEMRNALASALLLLESSQGGSRQVIDALIDVCADAVPEPEHPKLEPLFERLLEREDDALEVHKGIRRAVDRGLNITNQILSYANIGALVPDASQTDISSVIDRIVDEMRHELQQKNIQVQIDESTRRMIPMGENHLYIILRNLIGNAKDAFGADQTAPMITVTLRERGTLADIMVADNGPGMTQETQARLFQPFFSTKADKGVGLGLSTSRKLARMYGGALECESVERNGTQFHLRMPLGLR